MGFSNTVSLFIFVFVFSENRPNWFLAFQIDNEEIKSQMTQIQNHVTKSDPKLSQACVPVPKAHLTLFVFVDDQVEKVIETVQSVIEKIEFSDELTIEANEIGHFNHSVVYAKLKLSPNIDDLWAKLAEELIKNEIIEESAKNQFRPHLTLMKLSKMKKPKKGQKRMKKIQPDLYIEYQNAFLGVQKVKSLQLLSMTKPAEASGYYYCQHTFPLKLKSQPFSEPLTDLEVETRHTEPVVEVKDLSSEPMVEVPKPVVEAKDLSSEPMVEVPKPIIEVPKPMVVVKETSTKPMIEDEPEFEVNQLLAEPVVEVEELTPEQPVEQPLSKPVAEDQPEFEANQLSPKPMVEENQSLLEPVVEIDQPLPEPTVEVNQTLPEPVVEVKQISPESMGELSLSLPEPMVEVNQSSPETVIEVKELSPEPMVEVNQSSPEPVVEVKELSPEPMIEVNQSSPEQMVEVKQPLEKPMVEVDQSSTEPLVENKLSSESEVKHPSTEPLVESKQSSSGPMVEVKGTSSEQAIEYQSDFEVWRSSAKPLATSPKRVPEQEPLIDLKEVTSEPKSEPIDENIPKIDDLDLSKPKNTLLYVLSGATALVACAIMLKKWRK